MAFLAWLAALCQPGIAARAEGPAGVVVISQPAFTAPGAVMPVELMVTGTLRVGSIYAQYDLQPVSGPLAGSRTAEVQGNVGLNCLQWQMPAPGLPTEALWYRVVATVDGTTLCAPPAPILNYVPFGRWLNAGGSSILSDGDGTLWEVDRPWYRNAYGYEGVTRVITTSGDIRRTMSESEENLYRQQRSSVGGHPFHYRFYYGSGFYQARLRIELHFAELEKTAPYERIFDVLVDGRPLVSGLDLCAAAGAQSAYVVSREITVTSRLDGDQALDIAFVPRVGEAVVAGVAVRGVSAVPQYSTRVQVSQWADDTCVPLPGGNWNRQPFVRFGRYLDGSELEPVHSQTSPSPKAPGERGPTDGHPFPDRRSRGPQDPLWTLTPAVRGFRDGQVAESPNSAPIRWSGPIPQPLLGGVGGRLRRPPTPPFTRFPASTAVGEGQSPASWLRPRHGACRSCWGGNCHGTTRFAGGDSPSGR